MTSSEAERWLEFAHEDLVMAEYAVSQNICRQTCFHAQQAVEKALKAFLTVRVGTHPKSHSLEQMLLAYRQVHEEMRHWQSRLRSLDRFYLPTRYVDALPGLLPSGEPTLADAEEALRDAKEFVREIHTRIGSQQ